MELVSSYFKEASKAYSRETKALVEFIIQHQDYPTGTSIATTEAAISDVDMITNGERFSNKYASLEQGRFALDGSYYLPSNLQKYYYWSDYKAKADQTFDTNPEVTITLGTATLIDKMTILWGQDECAEAFNIYVNGGSAQSYTCSEQIVDIGATVTTIKIEIVKWSKPYFRAKIQQVDLGITKIYTGNELLNVTVHEQCDPMNIDMPSNSCTVAIENINKDFDILNPQGYYQYLVDGAPMTIKMGHVTSHGLEYIKMGKFYLDDYVQNEKTMTFSAVGLLQKLDKVKFYGWGRSYYTEIGGGVWDGIDGTGDIGGYTIKQVIARLMGKIGLTADQYYIPDVLNTPDTSIGEPFGWSSNRTLQTGRDLLKKIGICYGLNIYENRSGIIVFDYIDTEYPLWDATGETFLGTLILKKEPTGNIIDLDNCSSPPKAEITDRLYKVNFDSEGLGTDDIEARRTIANYNVYDVVNGSDIEIILSVPASEMANFETPPYATGTAAVTDMFIYDYKIVVKTSGTGTLEFAINDYVLENQTEFNRTVYNNSIAKGYELDLFFSRLFDWEWNYFAIEAIERMFNMSKMYKHTADWRQDLTNNIGDIVQVENEFNVDKFMIITQQTFEYNGALSGQTIGVGD